jgi:2-polyprenyl-6-hydroxyphenyl methylase/3-demethylubiquinone-9 3-methyltransferase
VLHHTGGMWRAIDAAAERVAPGGLFVIAIYRRTPMCGAWTRIKLAHCKAPATLQTAMVSAYLAGRNAGRPIARLRHGTRFDDTPGNRGMTRRPDAVDWLGGYPYGSARPGAIVWPLSPQFQLLQTVPADMRPTGIGASGCAEFVFRRDSCARHVPAAFFAPSPTAPHSRLRSRRERSKTRAVGSGGRPGNRSVHGRLAA